MSAFGPGGHFQNQEQQRHWAELRRQQGGWQADQNKRRQGEQRQRELARRHELQARFDDVRAEAARLRSEQASGRLTSADVQTRLRALMFQDDAGSWWMIGDTGRWYRNDGQAWIASSPELAVAAGPLRVSAPPQRHRMRGFLVVILCLTVTYGAIIAADVLLGTLEGVGIAVAGLIFTVIAARRATRGHSVH